MSTSLYVDFIRAALRARGSSAAEVEQLITTIRGLGGAKLNAALSRVMTDSERQMLAMLSGPDGPGLAPVLLDGFKYELNRCGISPAQTEKWFKRMTEVRN